jgi:hypothetical protein
MGTVLWATSATITAGGGAEALTLRLALPPQPVLIATAAAVIVAATETERLFLSRVFIVNSYRESFFAESPPAKGRVRCHQTEKLAAVMSSAKSLVFRKIIDSDPGFDIVICAEAAEYGSFSLKLWHQSRGHV